jgi:hypothetical protein
MNFFAAMNPMLKRAMQQRGQPQKPMPGPASPGPAIVGGGPAPYRGAPPPRAQAGPAPQPQFGGMWGRMLGPMLQRGMQQQQQPSQVQRGFGGILARLMRQRYGGGNALNQQPVKPTAPRIMGGGGGVY